MNNPEKLVAQDTQDEAKQNKDTTHYVLDTSIPKQTQRAEIRHGPTYKQLEVHTNQTSVVCGNRNGYDNIIGDNLQI